MEGREDLGTHDSQKEGLRVEAFTRVAFACDVKGSLCKVRKLLEPSQEEGAGVGSWGGWGMGAG